jgi:hypothetical protein
MAVMTREDFECLCELAGYGIGYWADAAHLEPDCYTVMETEEGRIDIPRVRVEQVLTELELGQYDVRSDLRKAAISGDAGEWDSEVADVLIQLAAFGEVVYS